MGWELVQEGGLLETGEKGTVVLSYHLFLRDYGIQNGDLLHAVVRTACTCCVPIRLTHVEWHV